uniref:Elongin-A n=1 Tax=Steinernema glaseri TaxID=37863 RepID=A0A1I8AJN9_9BILA
MHINDIEAMNGTPYHLVKPVLEKCTAEQLLNIEHYNEYLLEDTDELWARICEKKYPNEESDDSESWRDFYIRKQRESEEKLRRLTSRIGHNNRINNPVRTAMQLDSPKAPREVRKRALAFGTSQVSVALPSAIEVSKSRREIFNSGSKASFQQLPAVIRAAKHSNVGAKTEKKVSAPPPMAGKRGALMAKTLKMLKNKRR